MTVLFAVAGCSADGTTDSEVEQSSALEVAESWTECAGEIGYCGFSGQTKFVRYGANGKYSDRTLVYNGISCNKQTFGDPNYGVGKRCWFKDSVAPQDQEPSRWSLCAYEDGKCSFGGQTRYVRYGANGKYSDRTFVPNEVACNNSSFSDPSPGVKKYCWVRNF